MTTCSFRVVQQTKYNSIIAYETGNVNREGRPELHNCKVYPKKCKVYRISPGLHIFCYDITKEKRISFRERAVS